MVSRKKAPKLDYSEAAKNVLKAELKSKGVKYADLAELLTADGEPQNELNLNNKIARGGFSAAFLMQCLHVIGAKQIKIAD